MKKKQLDEVRGKKKSKLLFFVFYGSIVGG